MTYKHNVVEYRCDACGKILVGWDKDVMRNESYICIKGTLILQLFDEELSKRHFCHIIPEGKPMLTVCDLECLKGYIKFQKIQYDSMRDRHLRYQASTNLGPNNDVGYNPKHKYEKRY